MKLSAAQMIEPMAAPVGYSVGMGQGTGLGPCADATVVTGHATSVRTGDKYDDASFLPTVTAQPFLPPPPPPFNTSTTATGRNVPGNRPTAPSAGPELPPPAARARLDDFDEVDIYIPPGDGSGKVDGNDTMASPKSELTFDETKRDDNDDDNNNEGNGGKGPSATNGASYAALAARFDKLTK